MSTNECIVNGIHHTAMRVGNFDRSIKFYKEGLGFKEHASWGEGDKRGILLDTGDGSFFELFAGGTEGEKSEGAFVHVALRTKNCDLAIENAVKAGAVVTIAPKDVTIASQPPMPVRVAFCKGPNGEVIEFFQDR